MSQQFHRNKTTHWHKPYEWVPMVIRTLQVEVVQFNPNYLSEEEHSFPL